MGAAVSSTPEAKLFDNLATLVGAPRAGQFQSELRDNYVTLADMQSIAALGFNAVRVPFLS